MNDVRDEALGAVLDREAIRIESAPVDRLPEVLRRGNRTRAIRFAAIAAAVAVFAGAVSWAGLQNEGRGRSRRTSTIGTRSHRSITTAGPCRFPRRGKYSSCLRASAHPSGSAGW